MPPPHSEGRPSFYFNRTHLCGNTSLQPWIDQESDMGRCFQVLVLHTPAHTILALASAYALGVKFSQQMPRTRLQRIAIWTRIVCCSLLCLSTLVTYVLINVLPSMDEETEADFGLSDIIQATAACLGWLFNLAYLPYLLHSAHPCYRGPRILTVAFLLCAIVEAVATRSFVMAEADSWPPDPQGQLLIAFVSLKVLLYLLYAASLLPKKTRYLNSASSQWRARQDGGYASLDDEDEDGARFDLGVAKDHAPWISRLLLFWVNPLIKKGRRDAISQPDDVFELPTEMGAAANSEKFQQAKEKVLCDTLREPTLEPQLPLLKILFNRYKYQFFGVGLLKFAADVLGFAGPLLLSRLIGFIESGGQDIKWGYLYAFLLTASTGLAALCSVHFNLIIGELNIKVRGSVSMATFKHMLAVSSADMSRFGTGEIVNRMSTDVDRVVNFAASFHSVWSLPLQFAVTLGLLYAQLGPASLAGVVLTLLMVPINKVVASAIGKQSSLFMGAKDGRIGCVAELLSGMASVKLFGWENYFFRRVGVHRRKELKHLKWRKYLDAICVYLWATTPVLISVATFTTYVLLGNELTAQKVFTAVALFAMLTGPVNAFPWVLNGLVEAFVSIRRLAQFLSLQPFDRSAYFSPMSDVASIERVDNTAIATHNANFSIISNTNGIDEDERGSDNPLNFTLQIGELTVEKGDLVGVVGRVGSGKSLFLQAVLGELRKIRGSIAVTDPAEGVAYVQQEPWLQQGTVKDNILFGATYSQAWYDQVVEACALGEDISRLSRGDDTEIGENGALLSGGQRARVALARAVYQDKDVYLIDDVFAAVDASVGAHIYRKCIAGLLASKTRVLCTHHPRFLADAGKVVLFENGEVVTQGSPGEVLRRGDSKDWLDDRKKQESESSNEDEAETQAGLEQQSGGNMIDEEVQERGRLSLSVCKNYWKAMGHMVSSGILLSMLLMQASRNMTDVWLAKWVSAGGNESAAGYNVENADESRVTFYLEVYGAIGAANSAFSLVRAFLFAYGGICAAKKVHRLLLRAVLRARQAFFDSTPEGRILNRFSSDVNTVDDSLPFIFNIFLAQLFGIVGPLIVCIYSIPWIAIVLLPLAFVYVDVQARYRPASRQLKRVGSVSLSPVYAYFTESIRGRPTIRAAKASVRFSREAERRLHANLRTQYSGVAAGQWLEARLQLIGCAVVAGVSAIAVIEHHSRGVSPGFAGLAISYALGITGRLSGLLSSFTETEKELVAVERCYEYIDQIEVEEVEVDDVKQTNAQAGDNWPDRGVVSFKGVTLRYREHLPPSLTAVSFTTAPAEKIGVVGRTGAGKSSLLRCLFSTVDISGGQITVDGRDINRLPKTLLRRSLAILPQQPFLFNATVGENLDPLERGATDAEMHEALRSVRLGDTVDGMGGLGGRLDAAALSAGQKQLFCLARAMLSRSMVVCVDEATANVDAETDALVQSVLRSRLSDRTVLTVAHRLDTVMASDKIVVMDAGRIVEEGAPAELLEDPDGHFSKLVAESGAKRAQM